jgi:tape measure domain-containing protein
VATERIDIIVEERGSRIVKRNLEDIGKSAKQSSSGVDLLKRTLGAVGAGLAVREITRLLDSYTNLQNKLRTTGLEGQNLNRVWKELLSISNQTRTSMEGTVTVYSRLASSAKALGQSESDQLNFMRSLNTAVALSGATAMEAEGALIQLAQGIGAGALRGQELNSQLEQLPLVADVIAKQLGVARGQLRGLAEDGKITADVVFSAFKNAREELADRFAKSLPTIGQSFQVFKNQVMDAAGEIDKQLGVSTTVSQAILVLAKNVPSLVGAVVNLTKALMVAGAAFATFWAANKIGALSAAVKAWLEYQKAIAAGTVVVLGSAEAERQRAIHIVAGAQAELGAAAAALQRARAEEGLALASLNSTRATQAQMVAERELELMRFRAQINDIGRMKSMTRLAEIRKSELAITQLVTSAETRHASASAAAAAAEAAQTTTATRLAAAQGGAAAATAKAAGTTTILGQAVSYARGMVARLFAMISAHPIGLLVTAIAAVIAVFTVWRDDIKLGVDDLTTLGDLFRAIGEDIGAAFKQLGAWADKTFGPIMGWLRELVGEFDFSIIGILRATAKGVDAQYGMWKGLFTAVTTLWNKLPGVLSDLFTQAINGIRQKLGMDLMTNENEGAAKNLGTDMAGAFKEGWDSSHAAQDLLGRWTSRAQEIAKERNKAAKDKADKGPTGAATSQAAKEALDKLLGSYDSIHAASVKYQEAVIALNAAEKSGLITSERKGQILALVENQLKSSMTPLKSLSEEMDKELDLLRLTAKEREIEVQLRQIQMDMMAAAYPMAQDEIGQMRERLSLMQKETELAAARDQILSETVGAKKEKQTSYEALKGLTASGQLSKSDAAGYLMQQNADIFTGTDSAQAASMAKIQEGYKLIDQWRQDDLISEADAAQMKYKLDAQQMEQRLSFSNGFFGELAKLSKSSNKELATVGKAAAVAQATIQGILAIQTALASGPPPYNYAMAAAVATIQAANLAEMVSTPLPGFKTGGEFMVGGTGGPDSQTVAFRASPDERVKIETPAQQRASDGNGSNVSVPIKVVNIIDPDESLAALNSVEGERIVMNMISRNPGTIRKLLS